MEQLGLRLGITKGQVSKIETGKSLPRDSIMEKIVIGTNGEVTAGALAEAKLSMGERGANTSRFRPSGFGEAAQPDYISDGAKRRYSLFGCMRGTLRLDPNADLTKPDEELAALLERKYTTR